MPISTPRLLQRARTAAGSRAQASTRARLVDVAVAAAVAGVILVLSLRGLDEQVAHRLDLSRVLLACATAAPLVARRRRPWGAFVVTAVASIVFAATGVIVWLPVGLAGALYVLVSGRGTGAAPAWTPLGTATVLGLLGAYLAAAGAAVAAHLFHALLTLTVAWFAGERTRLRRAQLSALRDRADHAEQAAARERELAVAEERTRIARDLHDSAAHALSAISLRAGAARLRRDPDGGHAALTVIEELARQTMADIDQFVGSLRTARPAGTAVEAPPGLAALDALIAQHRAGGHLVDLARYGEPRPLAVPVGHGTYRILQEALTNATRHGTGTIRVELAYLPDALGLSVGNAVRPAPAPSAPRGGHGLIGMHERAHSLGGRLTAGTVGDRYVVRARLPYSGRRR